jgi:WD40 repeat protein
MAETTINICHRCPHLATIDLAGCSYTIILPLLATLAQIAFRGTSGDPPPLLAPNGESPSLPARRATKLYKALISASGDDKPVPVDDLLELITSKNLPQLLIDKGFLPPRKALSAQARISGVQVALLLGVIWGSPTNSNGSRVFSAVTYRIDNRLPLIAAVLQGDVDLIEVLLLANGRINQSTEDGTTPLLQATTQERLDIIELLINYKAEVSATKHDSMGLLASAIQAQNGALMHLAISHMNPQLFALKGSLEEALRNRSLLLELDKPSDLTHSIIGYCLLPKFLERWILSDETASDQATGVLGALLTIVPPFSTLHDQIRSVRNCVTLNKEFIDFDEFIHLTEQEGLHDFMSQLFAQEGLRQGDVDGSTPPPSIVSRHIKGIRFETFSFAGDQATGLCCSGHLVAWREPAGIVMLDARSGQICRKIGIRAPEGWLPHRRSSVLAFAHMDAGDQRLLISADSYSDDIKVYDWPSRDHAPDFSEGVLVHTLRGHDLPVTAIAASGNNSILISGSKDCRIIIWSIPFQKLTESRHQHMGAMAPPWAHRSASVIQKMQWHVQGILKGHPQGIDAVAISFNGTRVISGGEDGSIRIWDTKSLTCMGIISGSNPTGIIEWATCPRTNRTMPREVLLSKGVDSLAISRNGSRMAGVLSKSETVADQDFQVSLWLLRDDDQPASYVALKGHTDRVTAVCFHPLDETNVVSASLDQTLRIWDSTGRTCLAKIDIPSAMTQVVYALDGEAIAGYSKENNLVHTLKTPKLPYCQHRPLHRMPGVTLLHFSLSGNLIASAGRDCIHVWKLSTCNRIQTLLTNDKNDRLSSGMGWEPMVMEFSTHEQLLAAGGKRGLLMVWDLNKDGAPMSWQSSIVEITAGQPHKTPLWRGSSGDPHGIITTVAFSPDGDTLISGEENEHQENLTFRLWDVKRGTPSQILTIPRTDLPRRTFHLSFPTQTRITLWTRELPTDPLLNQHPRLLTQHSTWFWTVLDKIAPRWVWVSGGHSPPVDSPDDSVDVRTHDHLLIVEKTRKPIAFYNNMAHITAARRRGPNIVIGDRAGFVTFLLLQEEPDNLPLSPGDWPYIQVQVWAPPDSNILQQPVSKTPGDPSCSQKRTTFPITSKVTTLVRDLKIAIQTRLGLSPEISCDWTLFHGNRIMCENRPLGCYKVVNGSTVEVGTRLRGGMQSNLKPGQKKLSPKQNSTLSLFEHTSKQITEREASRKRDQMAAEAGAAMGNIDLDNRSQRLMEEGTRNELAALTRLRQEDNRLKSAKMLREEIEETLHPMEVMDMEKRQDFQRAVNIAVDLIRAQSGGPSEHRSPSFVRWMMAKTMERCETGQALSDKLIQECLRQPGNRTSVWLILRSRMENYTGRETPGRCPTNIEVQTSFDSLADSVNVSALPLDVVDKFRQGTDFQIALSGARHGLTEQVARDSFNTTTWSFDMSVEPPGTERLCLAPTNQEHNQTKLHSWVACLRASSHQHGCLDTRIEHALLAGILPSWNHELSQYANNLKGLRLETNRFVTTKAGRTRFKPSTAHLGAKSYQAPQIFIHIGMDRLATQQGSLADITRDILSKQVTLQMNMVADTDKTANNVITFSILPRNSRPATGQDEAWGRAKDRLRQERQMLDEEISKIIEISVSLAHGRGEYDEVGVDLIRSICQDITSPARSRTSQKVGDTILDTLKDNKAERLHEILAEPEPEAYVAAKVSGFPTFKAFFSSDEYKKYSATQKMTTFLQLIRNHLHERGLFTETAEAIYDGKKGSTPDDTLLVIFTTSSWKAYTSPPTQGEPILLSITNSIKKRLKAIGAVPFRISSSNSKPAPDLTFTPLEEDEPDNIAEDQTILLLLQRGDLIFVPKLPDAPRSIQRSTAWSDIPLKLEWASLQIKNIPDLRRPTAAPGILLDLLDRGEAKLLETSNDEASVWILTAYLDAILTLTPTALKDLCPTRSRETNRHLVLDPIKEAIKRGLLLHGTRGVWLENNPFETITVGSHPADQAMEPFSKRDPAALPLAITTMIGVPKSLGQGLSDITNQVLRDLVEANLLEPLLKKGHTLLIRQGSDLKTALLQTDKIRVGTHYTSSVEVPEEDIAMALDNTFPRKFPAEWGIVILSVDDDAEYPFETADFTPQLHSPDPIHIANIGSHILSQGLWITSSSALKRFRQKKGIIQQPLSSPRGIMWIYPGFQEPPNDTTHRSLLQLLGPQYGTLQFLSALGVRSDFKTSMEVLETLRDCRRQAILSELRLATEHRPIFIPAHSIRTVEGQRQAVPLDRSRSHQVQQNWLPRLSIAANNTEILQAAISEAKNDPKGVAAHILENHGVLLTTLNQFETVCLSTAMSALPEALLKEPVSMAELTGDMDYVISFEEDRREGNGGPAQSLQ